MRIKGGELFQGSECFVAVQFKGMKIREDLLYNFKIHLKRNSVSGIETPFESIWWLQSCLSLLSLLFFSAVKNMFLQVSLMCHWS